MSIVCRKFGVMPDGRQIDCLSLENGKGIRADIITYGARIIGLWAPDRNGISKDIVWGYDTLEEYCTPRDSQGAIIGRYAGRISNASFELDGQIIRLVRNAGNNTLHGGTGTGACFSEKVWTVDECKDGEEPSLVLSLISPDGDGGFPGNMKISVTYSLTADNSIIIDYKLMSDKKTVQNITSHCFFNLNGFDSHNIRDHCLMIAASSYTVTCEEDVVTGEIAPVSGTALDFVSEKPLENGIDAFLRGYNHNFVLNKHSFDQPVACLCDPQSGREMYVYTDQPGLQMYTAGGVKPGKKAKRGSEMYPLGAICLETQHFPDSVHHPEFPDTTLEKDCLYRSVTRYRFDVRK